MEKTQIEVLNSKLSQYNEVAVELGLPSILAVNPNQCTGQEKNARYFPQETFMQLVENIKADGHLESIPLVYEEAKGKYKIISGHHRIEASIRARIEIILVFVINPKDRSEIISKQLSHNSLTGLDDKVILKELFDEISDMQKKIYSGISSEVEQIAYTSLNFRIGTTKEIVLLFIPEEADGFSKILDDIDQLSLIKDHSTVIVGSKKYYQDLIEGLMGIKKELKIKSNPTALALMAENTLKELQELEKIKALSKEEDGKKK